MRDAINPTVQRAIVHLIRHMEEEEDKSLVASDVELPLGGNQKLREYFSGQVKNALKDGQTSSAHFSKTDDQSAIQECYAILTKPERFIPSSKELARLLLKAMGKDERIKPASSCFAVCVYTADNYQAKEFLALIKIDPAEALIEKVGTQNGQQIITFDVLSDVMPTKDVKLRKAALIPPKGMVKNLDLLLLDRQVATVAANFFAYAFLNTGPALKERDSTMRLHRALKKAHDRLASSPPEAPEHIGLEQADNLMRRTDQVFEKKIVKVRSVVDDLPFHEEARAIVEEEIKKEFPQEKRIKIDPQYAQERLTKKKRFRGDYGVLFEVESEHYDDVVKEKTEVPGPGDTTLTRLVIEVPGLQWVKR